MKTETEKRDETPQPKVWREMHESNEPRKSVCNCPFQCRDWDSHNSIVHGGHTNIREFNF